MTMLSILLTKVVHKRMRQVKLTACTKRGGNIDSGIFPLAYLSVFLVVIRSSFSWHIFYLYSHSVAMSP